jgi:hypothetical protein
MYKYKSVSERPSTLSDAYNPLLPIFPLAFLQVPLVLIGSRWIPAFCDLNVFYLKHCQHSNIQTAQKLNIFVNNVLHSGELQILHLLSAFRLNHELQVWYVFNTLNNFASYSEIPALFFTLQLAIDLSIRYRVEA